MNMRAGWTSLRNIITGSYTSLVEADKTHWISPEAIEYCALHEFDIKHFKGRVLAGDWDRLTKRFDRLDIYAAFKDVLERGCAWEDTLFFRRIAEELERGRIHWKCRTREELSERCRTLETLFESIRTTGYKSQLQLPGGDSVGHPASADDEITISIGRQGHLLFSNSAHRLCIAKLLKLEAVPVKVAVRHADWIRRVKQSRRPEVIGSPGSEPPT